MFIGGIDVKKWPTMSQLHFHVAAQICQWLSRANLKPCDPHSVLFLGTIHSTRRLLVQPIVMECLAAVLNPLLNTRVDQAAVALVVWRVSCYVFVESFHSFMQEMSLRSSWRGEDRSGNSMESVVPCARTLHDCVQELLPNALQFEHSHMWCLYISFVRPYF
jgi:hypothetical protein